MVVGGGRLRIPVIQIAMLPGVFILLVVPPKPDMLKGRGYTKFLIALLSDINEIRIFIVSFENNFN